MNGRPIFLIYIDIFFSFKNLSPAFVIICFVFLFFFFFGGGCFLSYTRRMTNRTLRVQISTNNKRTNNLIYPFLSIIINEFTESEERNRFRVLENSGVALHNTPTKRYKVKEIRTRRRLYGRNKRASLEIIRESFRGSIKTVIRANYPVSLCVEKRIKNTLGGGLAGSVGGRYTQTSLIFEIKSVLYRVLLRVSRQRFNFVYSNEPRRNLGN